MGKIDFLDFGFEGCSSVNIADLPQHTQEMLKKAGYPTGTFHISAGVYLERKGAAFWVGNTLEDAIHRIQKQYENERKISGFKSLLESRNAKVWRVVIIDGDLFDVSDLRITSHIIPVNFTLQQFESLVQELLAAEEADKKITAASKAAEEKKEKIVQRYKALVAKELKTKKDKQEIEFLANTIKSWNIPSFIKQDILHGHLNKQ